MISLLSKFNVLKLNFHSAINYCDAFFNSSLVYNRSKLTRFCFDSKTASRSFHLSATLNASNFKFRDRRELLKSVPRSDEGVPGEKTVSLDALIEKREDMFTDERTPNLLFNGIPFREVPIMHLKVSKNNTLAVLTSHEGKVIRKSSAGMEGFKNCRKGTNVAGQTTALNLSAKAVRMGISDVRVKVQGLGPGRMAAIKGIQMGGLNIISVTDDTRISFKPTHRPRKPKRL